MQTLSRGIEPLWLNDQDAGQIDVHDNDWVEVYNDHGVVVHARVRQRPHPARAVLRLPRAGADGRRARSRPSAAATAAGGHNSLTRARLKPLLMIGGYGQFTYAFNYWGPTGVNRDTFVVRAQARRRAAVLTGDTPWTYALRSRWSFTWTSASAATPAAWPARTSGPTAAAPNTCGGTTSRPSPAPATRRAGRTRRSYKGGWEVGKDGELRSCGCAEQDRRGR